MTYFVDLSQYTYSTGHGPATTKNVGWLEPGHAFSTAPPDELFLTKLWDFCRVSVAQSRGIHRCTLCNSEESVEARRNDQQLLLGTSEIRVFAKDGSAIYAAPTLIFHYVEVHQYEPPIEFRRAVLEGKSPQDEAYFEVLARAGLEWNWTSQSAGKPIRFKPIRLT